MKIIHIRVSLSHLIALVSSYTFGKISPGLQNSDCDTNATIYKIYSGKHCVHPYAVLSDILVLVFPAQQRTQRES